MKRTLIALVALALFVAGVAMADRFATAAGSLVRVEGTSTLHAWKMEGGTIRGTIEGGLGTPSKVVVAIPVASIRSEHAKMDKLMAEALQAAQHPEIRYELANAATEQGDAAAFTVRTVGKLTIAGVTREVAIDVQGVRGPDGRYTLTGTAPIKMTHFGIKPPTAMLGTVRTGDDVKVTFRWIVAPAG